MGGGALMTPMMMLFFNVPPLAAVSSDLVAAAVMKPVGSLVHLRQGTVNLRLVGWLCVGSVPAAFGGVLLLRALGDVQDFVKYALGVALLIAVGGLAAKLLIDRRAGREDAPIDVRPIPTLLIGMVGGLIVGMTSVGSGSLIIVMLLVLYPSIRSNQLVGSDLLQAVPLVMSAALGHILFGDFKLDLTVSLLIGSIPGVYLGARVSSRAPGHIIRPILCVVLLASALKLLGVGNIAMLWIVAAASIAAAIGWSAVRTRVSTPG
ncbi:sulfite exporter TauE/SafE family protein [Streptosporangiaceae bacterium NEAU-GS5]|nr:sulfite exporter TauE/SafE family protein [Streptosporangiaceae bacterium NEAU-GS5]